MSARIDHHIGGFIEAHDTLVLETVEVDGHLLFIFIISEDWFQNPSIYSDFDFLHHFGDIQFGEISPMFLECVVKVCDNNLLVWIVCSEFVFLELD